MKQIIPLLLAALIGITPIAYGQKDTEKDPIIELFGQYEDKKGVEFVSIAPALLELMKSGKSSDPKTQELISKIAGLYIITITDGKSVPGPNTREQFTAALKAIVKADFERIMTVKEAGERMELYVRSKTDGCKDCKSALLFTTQGSKVITVVHLVGTIDKPVIDAVMSGEIGMLK
ncbi:MAG: DUF4252 domain-containing protein [Prevotellaceae bacterium]|jgi:hypothetical protein|nr:DUF4252 domain-containing protein [Prevotellaceae bacterium]